MDLYPAILSMCIPIEYIHWGWHPRVAGSLYGAVAGLTKKCGVNSFLVFFYREAKPSPELWELISHRVLGLISKEFSTDPTVQV